MDSTTHDYTYVNGQLLAYEEGSNKMMFSYDEAGNPFGIRYNGAAYYYQTNLQGDVIGIINDTGEKVVSYVYDAWGKLISVGGEQATGVGAVNPLRYRGYVYDTDTGWYYLQSRYYDPQVKRFLNADDPGMLLFSGGDLLNTNLFAYCNNNPVNMSDKSGYLPRWMHLALGIKQIITGILTIIKLKSGSTLGLVAAKFITLQLNAMTVLGTMSLHQWLISIILITSIVIVIKNAIYDIPAGLNNLRLFIWHNH